MSLGIEPDPEEQRQRAAADLLLLRVALGLLNDARGRGNFETDQARLDARVVELVDELNGYLLTSAPPEAQPVQAAADGPDRINLSVAFGESSAIVATLRSDGVLLEQGVTAELRAESIDESKLSPIELEELKRAQTEFQAAQSRPQLSGERFLRALAADPQPDSEVQILAVELFADGLLVHHTFDQEPVSLDSAVTDGLAMWPEPRVRIQLEDDLGTDYYASGGGGGGGVQVVHAASGFAPAVPGDASVLRIEFDGRTTELSL